MIKFFRKRSLWLPTWPTLLILAISILLIVWLVAAQLHSFLSVTEKAEGATVLVIEGWIADHTLDKMLSEENIAKNYDLICTTGGQLSRGHYLIQFDNYASLTAATLAAKGIPEDQLLAAPSDRALKDRTYQSALGLKKKIDSNPTLRAAKAIDVLTTGVHARRTRTVFQKVLGDDIEVGIISADPPGYDAEKWYLSSQGIKSVIIESLSLTFEWLGKKDR